MKRAITLLSVLITCVLILLLASCGMDGYQGIYDDGKVHVSFDTGGLFDIPDVWVEEGQRVERPEVPEREGYEFDGWYKGDKKWLFETAPVNDNMTLKAIWLGDMTKVTLDASGGNVMYDTVNIRYGEQYRLETPQRNFYKFLGWYHGDERINNSGFWELEEDVTLTARWESTKGGSSEDYAIYWRKTELIFEMNRHTNSVDNAGLASAVDRYYAGEEESEGETVDIYVKERNDAAEKAANVRIEYTYVPDKIVDYAWAQNVNRIYNATATYQPGSVDIYCNFLYDLTVATMRGCFANLKSTRYGKGNNFYKFNYDSFADREYKGYYYDYMSSLTLSDDRLYVIASDYTTDVMRASFVIPVNVELLESIPYTELPTLTYRDEATGETVEFKFDRTRSNLENLYEAVYRGAWTYDALAAYCQAIYVDSNKVNPEGGTANVGDRLGFALTGQSGIPARALLYSSVNIIEKSPIEGESGKYSISYPETNAKLGELGLAIKRLVSEGASSGITVVTMNDYTSLGYRTDMQLIRDEFVKDNILFGGIEMLGRLESDGYQSMRAEGKSGFGILPIPTPMAGMEYKTVVQNLAKLVAVAAKSDKFELCSAFLDYQSLNSEKVMNAYLTENYSITSRSGNGIVNERMLNFIRARITDCFDQTYEDLFSKYGLGDYISITRWHEIIRQNKYQSNNLGYEYGELYGKYNEKLEDELLKWNSLII